MLFSQLVFSSSLLVCVQGEISEVILMGGGTRSPKVQDVLKKTVGRDELGKSINTDEAAALGAVYQAAYLSTGFRVKTFAVKDANVYPIQVNRNVYIFLKYYVEDIVDVFMMCLCGCILLIT